MSLSKTPELDSLISYSNGNYIKEKSYDLGKRSNRYLNAEIDYSTYPEGIGHACRGSKRKPDSVNKESCGSLKFPFVAMDNIGPVKYASHCCHKASCRICGMETARRNAKRVALNLLKFKNCGFKFLILLSLNVFNKKDKTYAKGYEFEPYENLKDWIKKAEKRNSIILKECGMSGFYQIFHSDRLHKIYNANNEFIKEVRQWSPHFHIIGIGVMPKSNIFIEKYGFTYRSQKSVHFNNNEQKESLIARIAYRLNHCAFSYNDSGRQTKAYKSYGLMANNMCKTLRSREIKQNIVNENDSPYVAKDIKSFLSSGKPKHIKNRMKLIRNRMAVDITNTGYARVKDDHNYIMLKNKIYVNRHLKLKDGWQYSNPKCIEKPFSKETDKKIYLKEVEYLREVEVKGFRKHIISSNELIKDKMCNKHLIDVVEYTDYNLRHYSPEICERVKNRAIAIKSERLKEKGVV